MFQKALALPAALPLDCQSLTSTAAAIGCKANRVENYWSAVLCSTDQCAGSSSFFAAMQRFPPPPPPSALDALYSFTLARPSWSRAVETRGDLNKRPFGRLLLWVWCITQWLRYSNLRRAVCADATASIRRLHFSPSAEQLYYWLLKKKNPSAVEFKSFRYKVNSRVVVLQSERMESLRNTDCNVTTFWLVVQIKHASYHQATREREQALSRPRSGDC